MENLKVGVYICHCGVNIKATVDVEKLGQFALSLPNVSIAKDYVYVCSEPGQQTIKNDIQEFGLNRIVLAMCSPQMHENTFRKVVQSAGMNPYCLEVANIREQCSWVHADREEATRKAERLLAAAVAKACLLQPLQEKEVDVIPSAMVIGGGIAGIQAALDIANLGFKVFMVEKEPSIGGHMMQLDKTFPTLDSATDILTPKMSEVFKHPNIELFTDCEVSEVKGYVGNFNVTLRKKSQDIFEEDKGKEEIVDIDVGTIIVATGYDTFDPTLKPELGYGLYPNVITGLEFEKLSSSGSVMINGKEPKDVVFVHCVGSRDKSVGNEYCSRICCMYTAKQAHLIKEKIPDAKVTAFYIDMRAFGKGFEEFYDRVKQEGVIYRRGNVAEVYKRGEKLIVKAEDTLQGKLVEVEADLVVLAVGMVPRSDSDQITKLLKINRSADRFFMEAHPKLRPVDTSSDGIFLAGCCQGPKDIPDTVAQASAAAVKASIPLYHGKVKTEPIVARINEQLCSGCGYCVAVCPYEAIELKTIERAGQMVKVASVNEVLCKGCGTCAAACFAGANQQDSFNDAQIFSMIEALAVSYK